jgi:uncharacterized membrane protein SirB2
MSKLFESFFDVIGWIRIVLSPLLIGVGIGAIFYFNFLNFIGAVIWMLFGLAGLIIGIIWANKIQKKIGSQSFLSRISASPDLDSKPENSEEKNRKSEIANR